MNVLLSLGHDRRGSLEGAVPTYCDGVVNNDRECFREAFLLPGIVKPEKMVKLQATLVVLVGLKDPTWSLCLAGAPLAFPAR